MTKPRRLAFIFTRDFSQWINETIRGAYVNHFPQVWGRGLEDQIVHFDGRTTRWYRYAEDYQTLAEYVTHKNLNDDIFSAETHQGFLVEVEKLRSLLAEYAPIDGPEHLETLTKLFCSMYPWYTLSVFLAGAWRQQFLDFHGEAGKPVLDRSYTSRVNSEGLVKLSDIHLRRWLGSKLEAKDLSSDYIKLLGVGEVKKFVLTGELPQREILEERSLGFVYQSGTIFPTTDFVGYAVEHHLEFPNDTMNDTFAVTGTVACRGGKISGPAQIIFNSEEIKNFRSGSILVTPMTSVEYLAAMKTAAAIVTDEGGLTCHAAIVSRELGVPCIIGTRLATKVFKDGDDLEIDATAGIVTRLG